VVGIAVGFGAQTLVRDILSGIFFLIDDAFRVGEYIDVGEGKGTVEHMSIRALMLRHQRGAVYTVPFGAVRRVANYSRDWSITKLDLRVPFDTDLDKVRRVVKKLGEDMAQDAEFGPYFLEPLKSRGVNHVDDSAQVLRVKFMTRPNDQSVVQREVYRRLQHVFYENGIEFATRRVVVHAAARVKQRLAQQQTLPCWPRREARAASAEVGKQATGLARQVDGLSAEVFEGSILAPTKTRLCPRLLGASTSMLWQVKR
jgi:small-conductance mechanosensitive channel